MNEEGSRVKQVSFMCVVVLNEHHGLVVGAFLAHFFFVFFLKTSSKVVEPLTSWTSSARAQSGCSARRRRPQS